MTPDERKAVRQELDRLYDPDSPVKDQLAVLREIIRLLEKNPVPDDAAEDTAESETLAEVRQHLEPLGRSRRNAATGTGKTRSIENYGKMKTAPELSKQFRGCEK